MRGFYFPSMRGGTPMVTSMSDALFARVRPDQVDVDADAKPKPISRSGSALQRLRRTIGPFSD